MSLTGHDLEDKGISWQDACIKAHIGHSLAGKLYQAQRGALSAAEREAVRRLRKVLAGIEVMDRVML